MPAARGGTSAKRSKKAVCRLTLAGRSTVVA